jgi:hypothetical protein
MMCQRARSHIALAVRPPIFILPSIEHAGTCIQRLVDISQYHSPIYLTAHRRIFEVSGCGLGDFMDVAERKLGLLTSFGRYRP